MGNNNLKYTALKTYKGFVSIRSDIVERAIAQNKNLEVRYDKKIMTIPLNYLKHAGQLHKKSFKSKFNDKEYFLYDFFFLDDSVKNEDRKIF